MMSSPDTEADTIARLRGFDSFLEAYIRSRMPSSIRRYVGVSDILQSVLIIALKKGQQLSGAENAQYRSWLLRIAERKIIDKMRRYRQRTCPDKMQPNFGREALPLTDSRQPAQSLAEAEEARALLAAIERLPDEVQRIIVLRNVQALTFNKIASQLGLPVTTCRRRWCEGLELLAGDLDESWGE